MRTVDDCRSRRRWKNGVAACAAAALLVLLSGCRSLEGKPRHRLGSLPFPGVFTLYVQADPENLGRHQYGMLPSLELDEWETDRGILYTRRAGFLDLAHVRMAADWCKYAHEQLHPALAAMSPAVSFSGGSLTRYTIDVTYPAKWKTLSPAQREVIVDELSIQIAQRVSYDICTWHEIITWFGYKSTVIIPEDASAFTYDDITSHVVGIEVAAAALRNTSLEYDDAVTEALDQRLRELEVVGEDEATAAVHAVEADWWKGGMPLKRFFDCGYDDHEIKPWLAPGYASDDGPEILRLPDLRIADIDFAVHVDVTLSTNIFEKNAILAAFDAGDNHINVRDHFPMIINRIRTRAIERLGASSVEP